MLAPYIRAIAACILGIVASIVLDSIFSGVISPRIYLPVHSIFEITSIVVSFAVFAIGWYGYRQTESRLDLVIAVSFLMIGCIDLVHTLSYKGMPTFIGENTPGKAAAYWLAARYISAVALLVSAYVRPQPLIGRKMQWALLIAGVALVFGIVAAFSTHGPQVSDLMFSKSGLTPLKKGLEYAVAVLLLIAFVAFGKARGWNAESVRLLRMAIIISIASELCFTLYNNPYDLHNLLGHIYKTIAYYFVLQALFVSSLKRPYDALSNANEQLQKSFSRIGEALASGLNKENTLQIIASLSRQIFDADIAAIGEVTRGGEINIGVYDGADPGVISMPVQSAIAGESFATGRPVVVDDLRSHKKARPEIIALGVRSFVSVPIIRDGRPAGAVYIWSKIPGKFTADDAETLTVFAGYAAIAIGNAEHYEREHHIADALQQVIFPPPDLSYKGLELAGKYVPAWDEARVGGDFYDYFDLGNGRLGVTLGDVSGKGLDAAVHTAIIKYSLQAYLREGYSISGALHRLDETFKDRVSGQNSLTSVFITLFCAVIDSATGHIIYSNAGHEPPMKVSVDGEVIMLDSTGPILGLNIGLPFAESETVLEDGETLVIYTDGITEARTGSKLFGSNRLVDALQGCRTISPRDIAESIYNRAKDYAAGVLRDDVAIIIIRRAAE